MNGINKLRVDVLMKDLSPIQDELMSFYETQPSHLGFLLSITQKEFNRAYKRIQDIEDSYLAIESALLIYLSKKSDEFSDEEMQEMIGGVEADYNLISLVRKGLVKYKIADEDGKWTFAQIDSEAEGHKLYGKD